jgi:hypothetical protein
MTLIEMREHIDLICTSHEHDLNIFRCDLLHQAQAIREFDEVTIPQVKSSVSYAVALHEFGHLFGYHQNSRRVMVRERGAWRYARINALQWTPAMERHMANSLAWYEPRAAEIDRRWRPAGID